MVLHFEGENADHRLINAFLGESSMLDCLLDRLKIGPQFRYAGSSKNHVVASFDREHCCLREAPGRIDARHEERICQHYPIIAQLLAQHFRDERVRELSWHHRINRWH